MNAGFSFSNGVAVEELRTGGASASRGVWEHAFPEKNFKFRFSETHSDAF